MAGFFIPAICLGMHLSAAMRIVARPHWHVYPGDPARNAVRKLSNSSGCCIMLRSLLVILAFPLLSACAGVAVDDYSGESPRLIAEEFFSGTLLATGVVKDRRGKVIRRFSADIQASWTDGIGTLDEDFTFANGDKDRRVWRLEPQGQGRYRATAGDVVGNGEARVAGNAMFLDYVLRVPYGDGTIDLAIDDRMYLVSPNRLINESVMRKFGFTVGKILLVIERLDAR